jgi:hypothetical protein
MTQPRLINLSLMSIENDILENIDFNISFMILARQNI